MAHRAVLAICGVALAGAAHAQADSTQAPSSGSNVTVVAPDPMVCRATTRTATRMRTARVCRRASEWTAARRGAPGQDEMLAEAADRLETLGEKVSTNCTGGMGGGHNGPLGPR